ncbi:E3 ubiquitin-protein ligase SHPRH isoform X1 [Anastrepha ludens]|uniref:E3 ubiquitin-protein ligase SHPRH isoform X1 n=1 Tax=Anastrepha ludens TaxID=28586 RepID=UPI0023AFE293|nr:E3 ubiquitin-protein ligase SHPRH isoform X1 [Anastrepha ludens]
MRKILLSKIAVEHDAASEELMDTTEDQFKYFRWNGKQWRTIFPFPTLILTENYSLEKEWNHFVFVEVSADNFLSISYKPSEMPPNKVRMTLEFLFASIFTNYPKPIGYESSLAFFEEDEDAADNERNLMQEYATTALYDALYQKHLTLRPLSEPTLPTLPECFRPTLCDYQVRTVQWLLKREQEVSCFPNYYMHLKAKDGKTSLYKHLLSWHVQESEPPPIELSPGGILADEMGLGKTVEMLALIVLNPRKLQLPEYSALNFINYEPIVKRRRRSDNLFCICTRKSKLKVRQCISCSLLQHENCVSRFDENDFDDKEYICPSCWYVATQTALLPAATTFIVAPSTIKTQWLSEIKRHIRPTLRVFDYNELAAANWVSPRQLATYDVVLTDYTVLRREIYHTSAYVSERVTRNEQRSMRRISPLLMVQWWRVCLDEAQMVESNTSKVAALVRQLPAVNRWAVTGTPIQRSINDLRGLLEFIGFKEPLATEIGWKALIDEFVLQQNAAVDCEHKQLTLVDVLQRCMWRTCKSKVSAELQIPPQTEEVHRITLSNLEKLFYTEQHALCESSFQHVLQKHLGRAEVVLKISPKIMDMLLQPLLKIRQCCIIPVVNTSSGHKKNSANVLQKQFLQPKDLHAHLKSTNEIECKSELRTMASSYNGMAAIYFIQGNYEQAIKNYEMVLRLSRDYKDINITVDSLLQIHALHNIQQAFYTSPSNPNQMSADVIAKYEEECSALEWKYLEPYAARMNAIANSCLSAQETLTTLESTVEAPLLDFINMLTNKVLMENEKLSIALLNRFHDDLVTALRGNPKMEELESLSGMLYILVIWYQKVLAAQKHLNEEFTNLQFYTMHVCARAKKTPAIWREMTQFISSVSECHLSEILDDKKEQEKEKSSRKSKNLKKVLCKLCQIRNALNDYECLLFNKVVDESNNMTEGLENPSFEVALIKVLFTFLRTKAGFQSHTPQIEKHWEAIECRQQLCKKLIKCWIEIEYTVKAYDELDMCKMRISLAANEKEKTHFKLLDYELDATFTEQQMNLLNAQHEFAMKLARLKYIKHLEADAATGPCPICQSEDENLLAVLECGHSICLICLRTIRQYNSHQKICCPICRNQQNSEKIYYVTRNATSLAENPIQVVGDFSSKITCIVRLILQLQHKHVKDVQPLKILVFSQWTEILHPIATALAQNGIRHRFNLTPQTIEDFKNPQLGVTCLLMPLRRGCNGLNLIEATHVLLVEPILNPGEEAQAIGRVHRFGQTKPTTVHRFIVCNTIEENIFNVVNAGKQSQSNWEFKKMSVESLRNLFLLKNDVSEEYTTNTDERM